VEAPDEVMLTNGDRLRGELESISEKDVVLKTKIAGTVKVERRFVSSVGLGGGALVLLENEFASGKMAPWQIQGGTWSVSDGKLVTNGSGSSNAVWAELAQDEAVTMVATVEGKNGNEVRCYLHVFAEEPRERYGRNSVYAYVRSSQWQIGCFSPDRGTTTVASGNIEGGFPSGTVRLSYDPKTGTAKLWLDKRLLGEGVIPTRPSKGKGVIFTSYYSSQISQIQVLRGVVAPSGVETLTEGESETDMVQFENRDRVSAENVRLSGGKFTIKTGYGELAVERNKVQSVAFRSKGLEKPRLMKGQVEVETTVGRMTVVFGELTGERLLGTSECWGNVSLQRETIRKIRFQVTAK